MSAAIYILLLTVWNTNGISVTTAEYGSKNSCLQAGQSIRLQLKNDSADTYHIEATFVCEQK